MSETTSPKGAPRYKYENGMVWANFDHDGRPLDYWRLCPSVLPEGARVVARIKALGIM